MGSTRDNAHKASEQSLRNAGARQTPDVAVEGKEGEEDNLPEAGVGGGQESQSDKLDVSRSENEELKRNQGQTVGGVKRNFFFFYLK